ncbi:MAG: imidazole glycerol phosphate synthase subunit HisF, partial [Ilumatobacteraceae bacterium]|nr:imidazole glycerol phosphate synthase subunit HisF [Ilumatobacteraceae bacterium]
MDVVASLYGRGQLLDIVRETASAVFVPLTVGGGVRSAGDFEDLLRSGADKVAVNT